MNSKVIKVCTQFSIVDNKGDILSKPFNTETLFIKVILNLTTKVIREYGVDCYPGECIIYQKGEDRLYFDVNKNGELIIIHPSKYEFFINESGELMMKF